VAQWRRLEGHRLEVPDLTVVLSYRPGTLVVGSGVSSMMRVPESTIRELESASIRLEIHATPAAVDRFNTLVEEGEKVAAAIHLTC